MTLTILILVVLALAYANGANDNFKGVATLFGIGTVTRQARVRMIATILSAWVTTLPTAALLGAAGFWGLGSI
ncbi:MAG: hypothetical protein ACQESR_08400 [Planctomycetota bacterium]